MRNRPTCKPAAITAVRSVGAEVHPGNIKEDFLLGGETTGIHLNKWPRRQGSGELETWFGLWGASDQLRGQVGMGTMVPLTVMIPQPSETSFSRRCFQEFWKVLPSSNPAPAVTGWGVSAPLPRPASPGECSSSWYASGTVLGSGDTAGRPNPAGRAL